MLVRVFILHDELLGYSSGSRASDLGETPFLCSFFHYVSIVTLSKAKYFDVGGWPECWKAGHDRHFLANMKIFISERKYFYNWPPIFSFKKIIFIKTNINYKDASNISTSSLIVTSTITTLTTTSSLSTNITTDSITSLSTSTQLSKISNTSSVFNQNSSALPTSKTITLKSIYNYVCQISKF